MKPIKISIDVNVNLPENVQNFFEALFASMTSNAPVNQAAVDNFDPSQESFAQAPAAPAAPAAPVAPAAPTSSLTIEDVRKVLSEKVNDHRAEIKQKLSDLGAPSVTKLEPSKYQEMYDFLKSL